MVENAGVMIWVAALGLVALMAFVIYRWEQRKRVRRVEEWVKNYLTVRYGELPIPLRINCSDDQLWPVLVSFDSPRSGNRHRLQFTCAGADSTFALLAEKEEQREQTP